MTLDELIAELQALRTPFTGDYDVRVDYGWSASEVDEVKIARSAAFVYLKIVVDEP